MLNLPWPDPQTESGHRLRLYLIILLPLALYGAFIHNPLVFDDLGMRISELHRFPDNFTARWIHRFTLWINATLGGQNLAGYRLFNIAIHVATAFALLAVVQLWLRIADREGRLGNTPFVLSWLGALLFAVHPAAVYGVGYLVERSIVLATLFALISVWLHTRAQYEGRPRLLAGAALTFALSVLSKEHAVALPGFLAILSYWLHRQGHAWKWRWTPIFLVYAGISIGIVLLAGIAPAEVYEPHSGNLSELPQHPYLASVLTQAVYFFRYLGLWLVPLPQLMSIDLHSDLPYRAVSWIGATGAIAVTAYLVVGGMLLRRLDPGSIVGLAMIFSVTMFATEFWAVRLSEAFVIYRSYLWMVFIMPTLVIAAFLGIRCLSRDRNHASNRVLLIASTVLAVLFVAMTAERLDSMSSSMKLWADALQKNRSLKAPSMARIYLNLGNEYLKRGDFDTAQEHYRQALAINPRFSPIFHNLGHYYAGKKDLVAALAQYDMAVAANPRGFGARFARADILLRLDRTDAAMAEYQSMQSEAPVDLAVLNNIAAVNILQGDNASAIDILESVIAGGRTHDVNYFNLALAKVRLGQIDEARQILKAGIAKHPDTPLLDAFDLYLSRETISRTRWLPRIHPADRAP